MPEALEFPRELIDAAREGNDQALETLAVRVVGTVVIFVRAAHRKGHYTFLEEDDVVQDIWIKVQTRLISRQPPNL